MQVRFGKALSRITMSRTIEAVLAECEDLLSRSEVNRAFDSLLMLLQQGSKEDLVLLCHEAPRPLAPTTGAPV